MELVYDALVVLHLLGMATIVSGLVTHVAAQAGPAFKITLWGASTQVVTGIALTGIASAGLVSTEVDNAKIAVKLAVAVVVLVLAHVMWRRNDAANRTLVSATAGLAVANVLIAVFW